MQRSKTIMGAADRGGAEGIWSGGAGGSWRKGHPGWVLKDEWELAGEGGGARGWRPEAFQAEGTACPKHKSVKAPTVLCLALLERKMGGRRGKR